MKKMLALVLALIMALFCACAAESGRKMDEFEPMYTLTEKLGFKLGAPMAYSQLRDRNYTALVMQHFNSITATNEMKAYSMLDQKASMEAEDGMPRMNYQSADTMVRWAQAHGIGVRGHVLVWDAYMTEWFFHEGYDMNRPFADRETMIQRLESYITQVVTHFEETYPGVVYCWDVVNEAVADSADEYAAGDERHLRTLRSGTTNLFRDHVGDDYVELSFYFAHNVVEALGADIKLYYNDYNAYFEEKSIAICALIESINHYAVTEQGEFVDLVDGVGMQGYIGGYGVQEGCLEESHLALIRKAIERYAAMGMEVQVTEMAVRNFEKEQAEKHADYYEKLFDVFIQVNAGEDKPLRAVSIWGLTDNPNVPKGNYVYNLNSPWGGLVTEKFKIKPAFEKVHALLMEKAA